MQECVYLVFSEVNLNEFYYHVMKRIQSFTTHNSFDCVFLMCFERDITVTNVDLFEL